MHTVDVLTSKCTALRTDIDFMKKEIGFLLKILVNCYSTTIHTEQLKLQDGYWKDFEEQERKLNAFYDSMHKEELRLVDLYLQDLIHEKTVDTRQAQMQSEFDAYNKELKTLKESFYAFMNGCSACALKTAC